MMQDDRQTLFTSKLLLYPLHTFIYCTRQSLLLHHAGHMILARAGIHPRLQ
jgi:hypothetical protein